MIDFPSKHIVIFDRSGIRIKFYYTGIQKWIFLGFGILLVSGPAIVFFAVMGLLADMQIEGTDQVRIARHQLMRSYVRMAYGMIQLGGPVSPADEERVVALLASIFDAASDSYELPRIETAVPPADVEALARALQGAISEEEAGNLLTFILRTAGEDRLNDRMVRLLHHLAEILDVEVPAYRRVRQTGFTGLTLAYSVLRLSPEASDEELSDAFRSLAKVHHPDKFASEDEETQRKAKEKFQEILQAFEEIKASRGMN